MQTGNNYQVLPIDQLELNEGQLKGLPKNPRFIKDEKYQQLLRSIEASPEFLEARTVIVYPLAKDRYITIAGNMRLRACRELGIKDVPCYVFPKATTIEKLKEFTIKDNLPFGNWDWDMLANEWEVDNLQDWGMECDFLAAGDVDFDSVEEITEKNYEKSQDNMLECPKCHHQDFAIHFKKVKCDAPMNELDDNEAIDLPEDTNGESEEE